MALSSHSRQSTFRLGRAEEGYILLSLLLMVALLVVAAAAVLPSISFEIKRDREQELIHRGVQYSRAIRSYYKKFGRYPTRIEELESTNNLRFLRKRYKDPITGQDFKLLHFGEVKMAFSAPLAGASNINGTTSLNNPAGNNPAGVGSQVQPGGPPAGGSIAGTPTGFAAATKDPSTPDSASTTDPNQTPGSNSSSSSSASSSSASSDQPGQQPGTNPGDKLSGQTFGGGPVVGVVSASTKDSIREFNHKKKYNEWQFIYDPGTDRGGLLSTPNQPPLQGFGNQNQAGQTQQQGSPNGSSFGSPAGYNSNAPSPGAAGAPPTPPTNPPDQQ